MRQSCSKVSAGLAYAAGWAGCTLRMNRASSSSSQTRRLCIQYSRSVCTFCVVIASSLSDNAGCCECQDQECRRQQGVGGVWAEDKQHGTVTDCNSGRRAWSRTTHPDHTAQSTLCSSNTISCQFSKKESQDRELLGVHKLF